MEAAMPDDWTKFDDQRGIDAKYRQADTKADLGQAGPKHTGFSVPEDPSGSGRTTEVRDVGKGAPQAGAEDILHPASPREDQQFAAIHDHQDELRSNDPKVGGTGDPDPKANSKPPGN
jgi:hypothetical protein